MPDIRIYDPPVKGAPAFRTAGIVTGCTSADLLERHYGYGSFTIEVPWGARHAQRLEIGRLVFLRDGAPDRRGGPGGVDEGFWGVIDDLSVSAQMDGQLLTVSGRQLKGIAADRITIPPDFTTVTGAQGYDPANGTTEAVMKHFVAGNMFNPAQPQRAVYGLEIAPDLGRGLAEDRYMSRHEVLSDVLAALGEAAELGYDIVPDLRRHKLVFDVVPGEDHSARQSERMRVVFDVARKTALAQSYCKATLDSRNLFYATMSGAEFADEALTVTYRREGEDEAEGIRRREMHLELSADTPIAGDEYNELRRLALIEAQRYTDAESMTCEVAPDGLYRYRRDYRLGDLVTVRSQEWGVTMHARLTEMQTLYSGDGIRRTATFGTAPLSVFGRLKRQIAKGT